MPGPKKDEAIIIVGAGVFGLSSALHLARAGYTNIHLFDKQDFLSTNYSFAAGSDGASADENKILRASYGGQELYQRMAFEAMREWERWNSDMASDKNHPEALKGTEKLWDRCGFLRIEKSFGQHEVDTQNSFPKEIKHTQYRITNQQRTQEATQSGIPASKFDPFNRASRGLKTDGILDMTAGYTLASKACTYALHLCRHAGVHLHLGPSIGTFTSFLTASTKIAGIKTADDITHQAALVIVATGGWTPSLLSTSQSLLETTAGTVLTINLPPSRPDLWDKYAPENFPVWSWNMGGYDAASENPGGLYGFPRTPEGVIKFGFRGAKWTNYAFPASSGDTKISYPKTDIEEIPERAFNVVKGFCAENMPDLLDLELQRGRLCWYTDSVDNSFLISHVPGQPGLMVASGGSGHGFKFLPVLGKHVVDVVEGKSTEYTKMFAWRDVPKGKKNGLEEGEKGWRTLDKQKFVQSRDWKL
ncbi:nucleotide-binding domain-containing protein [Aureobasidium pullulans]|uniref:Nucleotide-binding domain-containing protein n=1 Tax=Aureobasidium pullulans TaxID=5580 RepID=A0A4S9Y372_AURPU|nr:nucleotide-binding domain-containing protein [Aureobasidium pullulans]